MKFFLTVLLFLLVTINTPFIANGCFEGERDALLTFKASLHDPSDLLSSWQGQNCCNWGGITCNNKTHHVVKLDLMNPFDSESAFTGEINPSLLSVKQLTYLDLSYNDFSNLSIPKFIGSFEYLVHLHLSNSQFSGVIPCELGNLSRLQYLDLSVSQFTSTIPPQLGNISDLQYLNLYDSYDIIMPTIRNSLSWLYHLSNLRYIGMSGTYINPIDWSKISKLHLLETFILNECYLSNIPTDLFHVNLSSLTMLDLSGNSFHVTLPNWIWNLTSLQYLDLSNSEFHGIIPSALTNLASVNYLGLGGNYFKDIDLNLFSKLHNLRSLDLRSLGLRGDVVNLTKRLGPKWYNLEAVYLSDNNLSGNISTSWITQMRNLSIIDLSYNSLSGHISSEIGSLTQVLELDLSYNSLSGVITEAHFANLSKLEVLSLSHNNMLTVKINDNWVPPFQLEYLYMESCKVGPRFPSWLRGQPKLSLLELSNASITGVIPTWFWDIPLEFVSLSFNNITGTLPTSLQLRTIKVLYLNSNNMSGTIPRTWSALEGLDLSKNQINGNIPYNLCEMKELKFLDLSNNNISGEIPFCWRNISFLQYIDLSNNHIDGELPSSIGSLHYLTILQLDNNKLNGEIPSTLQQCKSLVFLSLARNKFSGKIPSWIGQLQDLYQVLSVTSLV